MKNSLTHLLLQLLCVLGLQGPAAAVARPATTPPTGSSLASALNPDGTLKRGANGSFDARQFRMSTAPDGQPVFRPVGTKGAGDERWADGFELNGTIGPVRTVVRAGAEVYIGGDFTTVCNVAANGVAKWNGTAWNPLGTGVGITNGVSAAVFAVAVVGNGDVYAGGGFRQAGGATAFNVAKWNGTAWSGLGAGPANGVGIIGNQVDGYVYALAVAGNGDVYAGGSFTQAGGAPANKVARWNGLDWSPLGTGTNDIVLGLATGQQGQLYAGGTFTSTGDYGKAMVRFGIYDATAPLATKTSSVAAAALFPNPAQGTATLRLPAGAAPAPLTLTDAQGRAVRRYPAPAGPEAVLDLRGLPAGTYVVRCGDISQRLVVE